MQEGFVMNVTNNSARFTVPHQPEYDHNQVAPMYWLVLLPAVLLPVVGIVLRDENSALLPVFLAVGSVLTVLAFSFRQLHISDEGHRLAICFGPMPLFRKRLAYADLASVNPDKTSWVDGWGIHWIPFRGWTYNLWGFGCVRLTLRDGRTIRVGTDDPDGLAQFLKEKIRQ
jgi:hypothetical protein